MGTFNGAVLTATGANGYTTDSAPIKFGLLNPKAMTDPTALAGTKGTECSLIHGDSWNEMEGSLEENIASFKHLKVSGDEVRKLLGNLSTRVNGTTSDTRVKQHNQFNLNARIDIFLHTRTEIHHETECREQKTEDNEKGNDIFHYDSRFLAWHMFMMDTFGMRFEFNTTMNFEKKLLNVGGNIFCIEDRAFEVKMEEIKTSLGGLATEIKAGKIKAAATHIKAIAGNINAGIALNADSPFG